MRLKQLTEAWIGHYIFRRWPLTMAAESGHAILDVCEEALARLLPVVSDINAARQLALDGAPRGLAYGDVKRRRIDLLPTADA
jgi:hypothetical protein